MGACQKIPEELSNGGFTLKDPGNKLNLTKPRAIRARK